MSRISCGKCLVSEKKYYIYHETQTNSISKSEKILRIIYCEKCIKLEKDLLCMICGNSMDIYKNDNNIYYTIRNKYTYGIDVCKKCIGKCKYECIDDYNNRTWNIGVICGHCDEISVIIKKEKLISLNLEEMSYAYKKLLTDKKGIFIKKIEGITFKSTNSHRLTELGKCKYRRCKKYPCRSFGWIHRWGYCKTHMRKDEMRGKLFITMYNLYNIDENIIRQIVKYTI